MTAPLRKITNRRFIAYKGTQITLECGHITTSYSGKQKQQNMRCYQCAEQAEAQQ
jgi:hypothetical protein